MCSTQMMNNMMSNNNLRFEIALTVLVTVLFISIEGSAYGQPPIDYELAPSTGVLTALDAVPPSEEIGIARDSMRAIDPAFMQSYKQCHDLVDFQNTTAITNYDQCTTLTMQAEDKYCFTPEIKAQFELACGHSIILSGWLDNKFFESPTPVS